MIKKKIKLNDIIMCLIHLFSSNFIIVTGVVIGIPALVELGVGDTELFFYLMGIFCFGSLMAINGIDYIVKFKDLEE